MANISLSQYRCASMQKIERFEHGKRSQKEDLEGLGYLQIEYQNLYEKILSFEGWARP